METKQKPTSSTQSRPRWLDLGAGTAKMPGFIGIDRFPLRGIDVVADLNKPLPFADNLASLVFASHALEHIDDLMFTMREIYRICQHGAELCIVAPYSEQGLNLANPYHKQVFNEHTPRFWTDKAFSGVDPAEYDHPHASMWGLSRTDHSNPGLDFYCLRMEFFYFPEYVYLSSEEKREARRRDTDVCDQIMYHLIALKEDITRKEDIEALASQTVQYYEPPAITVRRSHDYILTLQHELQTTKHQLLENFERAEAASQQLEASQNQLEIAQKQQLEVHQRAESLAEELNQLNQRLASQEKKHREAMQQAEQTAAELKNSQRDYRHIRRQYEEIQRKFQDANEEEAPAHYELIRQVSQLHKKAAEADRLRPLYDEQKRTLNETEQALGAAHTGYAAQQWRANAIEHKLNRVRQQAGLFLGLFRRARQMRTALHHTLSRQDARQTLAPEFQQLLDDSIIFGGETIKKYRLQPSEEFSLLPYISYPLQLERANVSGILLAPVLDIPVGSGLLGIEIVAPDGEILLHHTVPLARLNSHMPACFRFVPLPSIHEEKHELRVFTHDAAGPVRILEWRRYSLLRPGREDRRPFCGYVFDT